MARMSSKIFYVSGFIRRRIFFLLVGMSFGSVLIVNLIWLPSVIQEIRQDQAELRRISVQLVRDQIQQQLAGEERELRVTARSMRPYFLDGDREGLGLIAQRLLQSEADSEEVGILNTEGKEIVRLSRTIAITDGDLVDRSATPLFREGMNQEVYWGPVMVTETSEPRVTLAIRLPGSGLVFSVINLKALLDLTQELRLSHEGRAYLVDEVGRLIAAADPSMVLRQLSFGDRPLIQQLTNPKNSDDRSFVEDDYTNESGTSMVATGLRLTSPKWAVVIEQPQALLFAPIRQKIWFFSSLSLMGLILSFALAQTLSRRFTQPIIMLREGAKEIGDGNLEHRVGIETDDEIGELARQFNRMAEQLHSSQQATLSALTIPIISQTSEFQEVLCEVIIKVMKLTGAEAGSIRLVNDENSQFVFSVYQGFSEAYVQERPMAVSEEAGVNETLKTSQPFFSANAVNDSGSHGHPLAREGFKSAVYLTLQTPKKTFGIMTLANREPGQLSPRQADLFPAIAHQISVALQNARHNQELTNEIAERQRIEDELRTSEERLRAIVETADDAIITADHLGTIISFNRAAERMFGYAGAEAIGQPLTRLVAETFQENGGVGSRRFFGTTETGAVSHTVEMTGRRKDGGEFPVELSLATSDSPKGIFLTAILRDVTERRKTQIEISAKNRDLETLLHVISHDLREPLRAIESFSRMVNDRYAERLDDKGRDFLRRVTLGSDRMNRLLDDILTLSRAQRIELAAEEIDSGDIVAAVLHRLERKIAETAAKISAAPNLPKLHVDKTWLTQALYNLVGNALKFTRDGEAPDIEIASYDANGKNFPEVGIAVRDRGPGVPADQAERIFALFQRGVGREVEGTGAGLAIVRQIAERHGGRAWVQPREGGGSEFIFTFRKNGSKGI